MLSAISSLHWPWPHHSLPTGQQLFDAAQAGQTRAVHALLDAANVDVNWTHPATSATPLHVAVDVGQLEIVKLLLAYNATIDAADQEGWTALMHASKSGHLDVVKVLVRSGASITPTDKNGVTAADAAASNGHDAVREFLLEPDQDDKAEGVAPLYRAAERGHLEDVKYLLQQHGASKCLKNKDPDESPLFAAAVNGHVAILDEFSAHGAKLAIDIEYGWTLLIGAAQGGRLAVVQYLLAHGANVNENLDDGTTALLAAAQGGHADVVACLIEQGASLSAAMTDGTTPLLIATKFNHKEVVELLFHHGADLDSTTDDIRMTPLFFACTMGHADLLPLLIGYGADIHQMVPMEETEDELGDSCSLTLAAGALGHSKVVEFLFDHGSTEDRYAVLWIAAAQQQASVVSCMLAQGVDVNQDEDGLTPLVFASRLGFVDVVNVLLDYNANVGACERSYDGETALHAASEEGHLNVVAALVARGADPNAKMSDGATPLYLASQNGHLDVVKALLAAHATIHDAEKDGESARAAADREGHHDVVALLAHRSNPGEKFNHAGIEGSVDEAQRLAGERADEFRTSPNGHDGVVAALLQNGAAMSQAINAGATSKHRVEKEVASDL